MIPTWSDHAREARKYVRFARRNAVVSLLRYVAHKSATVHAGHPSPAQEPPMTTPEERHEADQDDADRYFPRPSVRQISDGDHLYVWREFDVVDGRVRPLGHAVYKAIPINPPTQRFTIPCEVSCNDQSWTGVDRADGPDKVWRCDTCGRIVSQYVSNPDWIKP